MARHRNVRTMKYEDELEGYEDIYGHSVEDDYPASPSTAQFLFDRSQQQPLSSFLEEDAIQEEEEEQSNQLNNSSLFSRPKLNDYEEAQLNSCLDEMRNILGESSPEHILVEAALANHFEPEKAVNFILDKPTDVDAPKPQRKPKERTARGIARSRDTITSAAEAEPTPVIARMTFSKPFHEGFTPVDVDEEKGIPASKKDLIIPEVESEQQNGTEDLLVLSGTPTPDLLHIQKKEAGATAIPRTPSTTSLQRVASRAKLMDQDELLKEYERRRADQGKDGINLVVIGHVDAGKSTLMGHVLYQLGFVNKRLMHKYEQESKKMGKASFAFAWILDETEEERTRGVTMDIAQTKFETHTKVVTLLDAPGHKDFIPNMITGASQADVAVMVVNATRGEFETGFEAGGQTREHGMLIRSLGVSQLIVAVNKMDTVEWSKERYDEITKKLFQFLKQTGFKDKDVVYIPCSGLSGENLTRPPTVTELSAWYKGPFLVEQIDKFKPPERVIGKPFRLCVADIFKGMGSGFCTAGTIQAGMLQVGERLMVMPQGVIATIKGMQLDDLPVTYAYAGDHVTLTITGLDMNTISPGSVLCDATSPIQSASRFRARVVIFNIEIPITKGFPIVLHYQSLSEPGQVKRLISQLNKSTGEVVKNKPRCLTKNMSAVIEIEMCRPICMELYKDYKDLGRFMLRYGGTTIAAGLVTDIIKTITKVD